MSIRLRCCVLLLAVLALTACDFPRITGCLESCSGGAPPPAPQYVVIGYPRAWIDSLASVPNTGVRLTMHVGDTVTLYVVTAASFPTAPFDTVRVVSWSVDSSSPTVSAQIASQQDGGGSLIALSPGSVIVSDGSLGGSSAACAVDHNSYTCDFVGEIRVEPRP